MEERRKVILREMEEELKATEEQKTKHIRSHASTMRVIEQLRSGKHTHAHTHTASLESGREVIGLG